MLLNAAIADTNIERTRSALARKVRLSAKQMQEGRKMHVFCNLEDLDDGLPPLCDMTFEIVNRLYDKRASTWRLGFRANASPYEPVGFSADIPMVGWEEQIDYDDGDPIHSFWGPVTLRSRGPESDRMLALLADHYGQSPPPKKNNGWLPKLFRPDDILLGMGWAFSQTIDCLAVGIQSNPALIADHSVHLKLFFDDGLENGHYAEVFLDVDLSRGICGLNEKDEEYRADLIHWFSRPGHVSAKLSVDR